MILDLVGLLIFDISTSFAIKEEQSEGVTDYERLEEYKASLNTLFKFTFGFCLSCLLLWM